MPARLSTPAQVAVTLLVAALVLCWPMLLISGPLVFFDTASYFGMGEQVIAMIGSFLFPLAETAGEGGNSGPQEVRAIRAVAYSVFLFVFSKTSLGLVLPVILQTVLTLALLIPFVTRIHWHARSYVAFASLVVLSTLPWTASYAMPDILAAATIVWSAILVRKIDEVGLASALALTAIACFAVGSHYGHIPFAIGLWAFVIVVRLAQRRISLRVILFGTLPFLAAMALNLTASAIALDKPSVTPKRLPILLARSLEDGPAAWYLEKNCDNVDFTICDVFGDTIPQNISEFLWHPDGIRSMSTETLDAVRAEEKALLIEAFKAYPVAQLWSFSGNALRQIVTVGTDDFFPSAGLNGAHSDLSVKTPDQGRQRILTVFDYVTIFGTFIGFIMVVRYWTGGKLSQSERDLALLVTAGLILNALIFGGLSAPVDRYQSRVAWLLPALWFIHVARSRGVR